MHRFSGALIFLLLSPVLTQAQTGSSEVQNRRAQLEAELARIEVELAQQRALLNSKQQERVSLERDVAILDARIEQAKLGIRARNLVIAQLTEDIASKEATIGELGEKLEREKQSLAQLLRKTNEIDQQSLVEVVLGSGTISDFFSDLDSFASVKSALSASFEEIAQTKDATIVQKTSLEDKRAEQLELRAVQELEKRKIEDQEAERKRILAATKGQEKAYLDLISGKEKTAAQIRSELFTLRDSAAIPFGQALEIAKAVSQKTGVRPAFLLGVLAEETNLGENLGSGTWTVDMHPTRDRPIFLAITQELGLDPNRMPVSKKAWYGWGGAMGPAQFIPSTWACFGGFVNTSTGGCGRNPDRTWSGPWVYDATKDRIRALVGKSSPSNPWDNADAFMASGALLADNGAAKGTFEAERLAALRYLAGWTNATNPAYAFYGDDVMELAAKFQSQIDILSR